MIAACPRCGARYRIDPARLRADGVRLRCSKCEAVFRIAPPPAPTETEPEEPGPARAPQPADFAEDVEPRGEEARRNLVLVADADLEAGKALANTLGRWGLEPVLVHDGVEAILSIQRMLPPVVILDAGLPKMFGFQVCELMKRNRSLRSIHVVLVGAIHHQRRYRRAPSQLYGADAYVERPQLPEALRPILRGFGLGVGGGAPPAPVPSRPALAEPVAAPRPARAPTLRPPSAPASVRVATQQEVPVAVPEPAAPSRAPGPPQAPPPLSAPPQPAGATAAPDSAVAAAERLARIIVSDLVLYNPEKFEAGIRDGNVLERLESELEEARSHFDQRVELRLRESRDFLGEEVVRVARLRGMK